MVGETIELLFRVQDVVIVEENSGLEKLLFRIEGVGIIVEDGEQDELLAIVVVEAAAADGVGTMEDVETTELLFKTYSTGPAEDVRTIEGVETMEHARLLRDLGCDILQGFALAKPMSGEDLEAFMSAQTRLIAS